MTLLFYKWCKIITQGTWFEEQIASFISALNWTLYNFQHHFKFSEINQVFESLKNQLSSLDPVQEAHWQALVSIVTPVTCHKNDHILSSGQVCKGVFFVEKGAFRTFHLKGGHEIHTAFYFENDFIRDIESLTHGTPSSVNICALEDAEILYINKEKMFALYQQIPSFQSLGIKLLELMLISEKKYASLFTDFNPEDRYKHILVHYPILVQRVPLQYLASFLGVARETLSRIRKRTQ